MALEQAPELERPVVDIPDPIVDLLQAHVLTNADGRDVYPAAVPSDAAIRADVAHVEPIGIFQRGERRWHLPARGSVARRRRLLIECLVWALMVKLLAKIIEPTLGGKTARGRSRGRRFQGAMHAFMPPILIGTPRLDELGEDTQAHPPGRELREPGQGRGGKWHAVVRADPRGQAILLKQPGKNGLRGGDGRGAQGLAAQEIATKPIGHRQGVAVAAVAGPELPLVVGAPDIVRRQDLTRRLARMPDAAPLASGRHHPVAAQDVARGGAPVEEPPGMALVQRREEFLASPGGMAAPGVEDRRHDFLGRLIRRAPRPARAQAGWPVAKVALDPFVAGLAGEAVVFAQLSDRQRVAQVVGDELRSLVYG